MILLWKGYQFGDRTRPLSSLRSNMFCLWSGPCGWPALTEGSSPKSVMCYSSNMRVSKTIVVTVLLHILQQMAVVFIVNYNNMFLCFYDQKIKKNLAAATEIPWVLHFDKGPMDNLEMRKLPAFTTDVNVSCLLADVKTYLGKVYNIKKSSFLFAHFRLVMLIVARNKKSVGRYMSGSIQWWLFSKHMDTMSGIMVGGLHRYLFMLESCLTSIHNFHLFTGRFMAHGIHHIPKWRPINYSFVYMLISPLCLVNTYKKQKNFEVKMRQRGLNMQTKE